MSKRYSLSPATAQSSGEAIAQIEAAVASRFSEYLGTLDASTQATEVTKAAAAGASATQLSVEWSKRGVIRSLWAWRMRIPVPSAGPQLDPGDRARMLLDAYPGLLGLSTPSATMQVERIRPGVGGATVVRLSQRAAGLPVFGASLVIHFVPDGDVDWLAGLVVPDSAIPQTTAQVDAAKAAAVAGGPTESASLGWLDQEAFGQPMAPAQLVWRVSSGEGPGPAMYWVYVDAQTGKEVTREPRYRTSEHKEDYWWQDPSSCSAGYSLIYDDVCETSGEATCPQGWCANNVCQAPPPWPGASDDLNVSHDRTHDYYALFGRDGWDNAGIVEKVRGNVGSCYPLTGTCNAGTFTTQILFHPNMECIDVVGHEYAHLVQDSEYQSFSNYCSQQDALSEGISDVMGEFTEAYWSGTGMTDWLGGGCNTSCPKTRSLRHPSEIQYICGLCGGAYNLMDPPDNWSNYRIECDGHFNSTVIGKAGYLAGRDASEGAETHWGITVTGIGERKASAAWYRSVTELLTNLPTLTQFRNATVSSCAYYYTGADYQNCVNAVEAVGLWTSDADTGSATDAVTSAAYFSAAGHQRWMLYKNNGTSDLYYRYQWYWYGLPLWSDPPTRIDTTTSGPATSVYGGYMWVCFRNASGTLSCDRMNSSGTWSSGPNPGGSLEGAPTLATWAGKLYVSYRRSTGVMYWKSYDGVSWSSEYSTAQSSTDPPVLASSNEDPYPGSTSRLWLVYRSSNVVKYSYLYKNVFQNWVWSTPIIMGQADQQTLAITSRRPAAAMFRGRLHVATTNDASIWYASCSMPCSAASNWTRIVEQDYSAMGDMHLEAFGTNDGRLYLWHRLSNPDPAPELYRRSKSSE